MPQLSHWRLQAVVFTLVSTSFVNIYLPQPVLPILREEFSTGMVQVSFTVSAVILGIALANLPFGYLVDRLPIHPIIASGGIAVALGGLACALTDSLGVLIGARFLQGIFIPALTTCLVAYLATELPAEKLNVVMGSYVSATVLGGLGGRLLGGWIHPPLHWRYAFFSASLFTVLAAFMALRTLPRKSTGSVKTRSGEKYLDLMRRWELVRIYLCGAGSFWIFSTVFNYLPFRLNSAPFNFSTELTTLLYLVYVVGIFLGPLAGHANNRFGSGPTMLVGVFILGVALLLLMFYSIMAILSGLVLVCLGFFTIHTVAFGSLNRRLSGGQGRANALYVLLYYMGGWVGITWSGYAYEFGGWSAVIYSALAILIVPLMAGLGERRTAGHR